MSGGTSRSAHKPRELRRRVVAAARLRQASGWSDASILNISSRGLQIHTGRHLEPGSRVELRRGELVINAQVIWSKGARAGLKADERIPVEEIAANEVGTSVRPIAGERRRQPRSQEQERLRGRAIEFAGVAGIALVLAAGTFLMVGQALARPLAAVARVLG
ncbi:MAG TPA: PilZ domain-containing protein [Sphingomicrobium sp.]|jgi:hypothetical protein